MTKWEIREQKSNRIVKCGECRYLKSGISGGSVVINCYNYCGFDFPNGYGGGNREVWPDDERSCFNFKNKEIK